MPNEARECLVITDEQEEIIWVPKFANSYLSIPLETDKIHYRLLLRQRSNAEKERTMIEKDIEKVLISKEEILRSLQSLASN